MCANCECHSRERDLVLVFGRFKLGLGATRASLSGSCSWSARPGAISVNSAQESASCLVFIVNASKVTLKCLSLRHAWRLEHSRYVDLCRQSGAEGTDALGASAASNRVLSRDGGHQPYQHTASTMQMTVDATGPSLMCWLTNCMAGNLLMGQSSRVTHSLALCACGPIGESSASPSSKAPTGAPTIGVRMASA